MRSARIALALCLALGCGPAADRNDPRGTDRAAADGAGGAHASTAPRSFHLFGWLSPPPDRTDSTRIAEMRAAGFDLVLPYEGDRGREHDNLRRLDLAAAQGMRCLITDRRLADLDPSRAADAERLDAIVASYRDHPGLFGYYLGDEPRSRDFERLAVLHDALRERDPEHPAWNNLLGRLAFRRRDEWLDYTRAYLDEVKPAVLCNDQYDFLRRGDRLQFVENAAGLGELARAAGRPWWGIVQLVEHGGYRSISAGELRWQVAHLLAYGASGVGYFTYWTPAPDPQWNFQPAVIARDGTRTHWFDELARFNRLVRAAGETLVSLEWWSTMHSGAVPRGARPFETDDVVARVEGRAAIGRFGSGGPSYLVVVNSDSSTARPIALELRGQPQVERLDEGTLQWARQSTGRRLELELAAGSFALVRIEPEIQR